MDGLVAKKFDFKKRTILKELEDSLLKIQGDFNSRGMLHSGFYVKKCSEVMARFAENVIDALLETYREVGESTREEIIIAKEREILDEVGKLATQEGNKFNERMIDLAKKVQMSAPQEIGYFCTNLQSYARDKAEILIENTKRRVQNSQPKKILTNEVFVIMQIGNQQLDRIWKDVYVPVIQDFKLEPRRIDRHNEGRFLMSEVATFLNRSKLVIADLTNA